MQTYNFILRGIDCIQLSTRIPKKAQLIIKRLCRQIGSERLGVQKNGIEDVKNHQWYSEFEWEKLQARKIPAPLILPVKSNIDLSNFEDYPKDRDETPDEISGWDANF
jgi:cGMP-dependent protein kinase 1